MVLKLGPYTVMTEPGTIPHVAFPCGTAGQIVMLLHQVACTPGMATMQPRFLFHQHTAVLAVRLSLVLLGYTTSRTGDLSKLLQSVARIPPTE